jgi:hypothetical protein
VNQEARATGRSAPLPDCAPDTVGGPRTTGEHVRARIDDITIEYQAPAPPEGEFFGEQRLADFISAAVAAEEPAPEMVRGLMRRVLTHQADQLQDDASIVVLEWLTGDEQRLPL